MALLLEIPVGAVMGEDFSLVRRHDLRYRRDGVYAGLWYGRTQVTGTLAADGSAKTCEYASRQAIVDNARIPAWLRDNLTTVWVSGAGGLWIPGNVPAGADGPGEQETPGTPPPAGGLAGDWDLPVAEGTYRKLFAMPAREGCGPWMVPVDLVLRRSADASWAGRKVQVLEGGYSLDRARFRPADLENVPGLAELARFAPPEGALTGNRRLRILADARTGTVLQVRDQVEALVVRDPSGLTHRLDGFVLIFPGHQVHALSEEVPGLREDPRGLAMEIPDTGFLPDSAEFRPGQKERLAEMVAILVRLDAPVILVRGHTADVGSPESQQALSEQRARAVSDVLVTAGVDPGCILMEGVGGREPVAGNDTPGGREANRRVEILLVRRPAAPRDGGDGVLP